MPDQGLRLPWKSDGKRVGRITASCRAVLAASSPATLFHGTLGFSATTISLSCAYSLVVS
jgi:hypothetical protein